MIDLRGYLRCILLRVIIFIHRRILAYIFVTGSSNKVHDNILLYFPKIYKVDRSDHRSLKGINERMETSLIIKYVRHLLKELTCNLE